MCEHAAPAPSSGRCIYGYVLFLVSNASLVIYLIWAFVPTHWLYALGLTYLPSKYWALAFPVFVCTCIFICSTCIYPSVNYLFTPSLQSTETIFDSHTRKAKPNHFRSVPGIPAIGDLPINIICEKLYLKPLENS